MAVTFASGICVGTVTHQCSWGLVSARRVLACNPYQNFMAMVFMRTIRTPCLGTRAVENLRRSEERQKALGGGVGPV